MITPPDVAPASPAPAGSFARADLVAAITRPHLLIDRVLGRPDRLAENLVEARELGWLVAVLLLASVVYAVPFGAVPPVSAFGKIAVLFTGSVLVCYPSLHVFGAFLGFRLSPVQNLVVALLVPATASLFSFGLSPIVWFIHLTTDTDGSASLTPAALANALLVVCLAMGIIQVGRCLFAARSAVRLAPGFRALFVLWIALLVFITYRMAGLLDLV